MINLDALKAGPYSENLSPEEAFSDTVASCRLMNDSSEKCRGEKEST